MSGLQREVLKWVQSLDLTWQVKVPKWDLTNGYLIAEIFSWYHPQEITMHSYNNGTSLDSKLRNWAILKNFIKRHKLEIPEDYIEGTIHCKEGAAHLLVEKMFEILTNRNIRKLRSGYDVDFTDRSYQEKLPMHARSTASQAIKNNLRITEIMADTSLILSQQKTQSIINDHVETRRQQRLEDPNRFHIKPTLGEKSLRRPPPPAHSNTDISKQSFSPKADYNSPTPEMEPDFRAQAVHFKEVQVNQMGTPTQYRSSVMATD